MNSENTSRAFATPFLVVIVAIAVAGGGAFLYMKAHIQNQSAEAILKHAEEAVRSYHQTPEQIASELASGRADLRSAKELLDSLRGGPAGISRQSHDQVADAVHKTDVLFDTPETEHPQFKLTTADDKTQLLLESQRLDLGYKLNAWEIALNASHVPANQNSLNQIGVTTVHSAETYVNGLGNVVGTLTPTNSPLAQAEIQSYQVLIGNAATEVNNALSNLTGLGITPAGNEQAIHNQEIVVGQIQNQVDHLLQQLQEAIASSTGAVAPNPTVGGGAGTPGVIDTGPVSPFIITQPVVNTSGKPKLIQGSNTF